ncbi:MAG: hypothetical protein CTY15_10025 [Methylocystis sp.]|nr:MAG: hypothetical protein CTY15_10025 [Methylocystis sp.]
MARPERNVIVETKTSRSIGDGEAYLRAVIDALPHEVAVLDNKGFVVAANERWLNADQTIGFFDSADIALDSSLLDSARRSALAGNDYARRIVDGLEAVLAGALEGFEIEYPCGSGEVRRWFLLRASRAPFERGGAILSRDEITARREAEERARRDALRLKLALDASFALSFEWDIQRDEARRFVSICEDLPVTPEEAPDTFEGVCQKVLPEDREHFRRCVRAAMESDSGHYECEYRLARPDRETVWLAEKGRVERDAAGNPLRLIGLAQNVTDRKRAEESLRRQRDELDWLYRNAPIGLALLDLDLRYMRMNQRLSELNGHPVEAHLGRRVQDILPAFAPRIEAITQRVRETKQAVLDVEFWGETPAAPGIRRFWNTSWHPHLGAEGEVVGFGVVVEETTERKRAELALRDRAAREKFLVELGDRLRSFTDAFEIQGAACRLLGAHLDADRVYYGDVYEDQDLAIIRPDYFREGLDSISGHYRLATFPEAFEALKTGRALVIQDTQDASVHPKKLMESYRALGIGALAAAPLLAGGRLVWTLNVVSSRRREWREEEVGLIVEVARRTWETVKRALAESALRESEQRERRRAAELRAIFDTAPIGLAIAVDRVGESIRGNRACEQLFGLPPGGELSKTAKRPARFHAFQNGRELTAGEMPMQRAVRGEAVGGETLDIVTERGERVTVFAKAMPLYDEAGNPRGAVGAFVDITKMKRTEDALRENEERFRLLVESYAQAVWETDADGVVVEDSPSWRAYTGQTLEEGLGHGWIDALHPDDRESALRQWREAVAARGGFDAEYRLRHRDQGWRWTNVRATPIIASDGSILKWVGMNIDIDARRRAEAAVRESEAAIRRQHEELDWVYQNAPVGLCILDRDLRYLRINRRLAAINGLPVDAHIGKTVQDLLPQLVPAVQAVTGKILQTGEAVIDHEISGETPAAPGATRIWRESWYPVRGGNGEINGFGVVVEEITERRKVEAALLESEERYRTLFEKMDEGYCIVELLFDERGKACDYRFIEANPAFEKQSGLEDAVGRTMRELEPDVEPKWFETYGAIATTGVARRFEEYSQALGRYFSVFAFRVGPSDGNKVAVLFTDVTERKKADASLRDSEMQFRAMFELTGVGMAQAEPFSGRLLRVNETFARMLGYERSELVGVKFTDVTHPEDRAADWERFSRMLRTEAEMYDSEKRYIRKDGSQFWGRANATLTGPPDGVGVRTVAVIQDISAQKRIEQSLRESEARLEMALQAANAGVWELRPATGVFTASARARMLNGCSADAVLSNEAALDAVHEKDRQRVIEALEISLATSAPFKVEYRVRLSDGSVRWLLSSAEMRGEGEARRLVGFVQDIHERKQIELALRESELRLKLAIDGGKIGIFEWRIDKGEVIWDDRVRAQWGVPPGAPVSYETFITGVHPQDRTRVEETIERLLDPHEASGAYDVEYRVVRGEDREERWIAAAGNVFRESGRAVRLIGAAQDITERKRVEEALKDADRRKDEFLATLAHELRNPLAPIRNAVHVMRHNALATQTDKRDLTLLSMIERQTEHLIRLVDDLLEVSRITRGKIELRMARVDLLDILSHALETAQPTIEKGGHVLAFEKPSEPLLIEGDAVRLTQVFTNLLNNAAKYTPHGGAISIRAERRGGKAVVTVRDSGVGIPAEMLPRVFDLFTQVDRSLGRSEGGLGIGLALVRSLLQLQGGSVEALSDGLGRGSAFVVSLPALGEREAEDHMEPARVAESTSRRILVIDDDHDVADSLVMFLETFGAQVSVAYSGAEGVESVKTFRPAIVFLDLGMPQMDGYETARRIRALPEGRGLTLVALTGWGQDQIQDKARDCGFDRQITKPAGLEALQEVLASA